MPSSQSRAHGSSSRAASDPDDHAYELEPILPNQEPSSPTKESEDSEEPYNDPSSTASYKLPTPTESRALLHKLDTHLVLFLSLLYLLSFLDRSNIGNARIAGLASDLHLSDTQYEWLLWAFYITYIAFEWMALLYRVVPAHIYISLCIAAWGLIASLQATVSSFGALLVLRGLLGVSEAAFGPGVPFYLSFFYRREELAFRTGLFISASPLSASFAGALAWVITKVGEGGPLSPWRLLFLVEGFPSLVVAVWAWDFVPDGPGSARWLGERERWVAVERLRGEREREGEDDDDGDEEEHDDDDDVEMEQNQKHAYPSHRKSHLDIQQILRTLKDPKCYLTAAIFFSSNVAFASMPVFLPTILLPMTNNNPLRAQALSAPPYLLAFASVLITAHLSDRHRTRSPYIILHALLAAGGYATVALCGWFRWGNDMVRYFALYPSITGFFTSITLTISWTLNNQASPTGKGTSVALMNIIGQMGPLVGTSVFPSTDGPWYVRGMSVCAGFMLLVAVLAGVLRWYLGKENARMGAGGGDGAGEYEGVGRKKRRRKPFVYML